MKVDAVVFDLGEVLLHWRPTEYYDQAIGEERRKVLFDTVDLIGMNLRSDLGEDIADLVEEYSALHPDHADDIRRWHLNWPEIARPEVPGTAALVRALKARGVPIFALTNFGVRTLAMADGMYPVLTEFDRRFVSGALRLAKPDPAIYAVVETETGFAPEKLFFTDDRPENIAAAEARGWKGHLFEGAEGLARRLVDEGVLTEKEAAI